MTPPRARLAHRSAGWLLLAASACGAPPVKPTPPPPAAVGEIMLPRPAVAAFAQPQLPASVRTAVSAPGSTLGGVRLEVIERHDSSAVFLRWVLPGGRSHEIARRWPAGTVQLTAELLTMGTRSHPDTAFATALAQHGAQLEVLALADGIVLQGHVLSHELVPLLELIREALTEPALDKMALENLRKRHKAALVNEDGDVDSLAARIARRLVYGPDHVYGSPGVALETLPKIQRKHVVEAWQVAFAPGGSDLVVVGDVDAKAVAAHVQSVFGKALATVSSIPSGGQPPSLLSTVFTAVQACHAVALPGAVQTAIVQTNPGPARRTPEWPVLALANQILGGSASSRLFTELREKRGLTYGIYSAFEGLRAGGRWTLATDVATAKTGAALATIAEQLTAARTEPPQDAELLAARQYLAGQFALSLASPENLADLTAAVHLYDLPTDVYARLLDGIEQATPVQVLAATKEWLGKSPTTTVLVGNVAEMRPGADAACPRLVQRDVRGQVQRVLIGTDAEMGEAGRSEAFAAWARASEGLPALARFVADTSHAPAFRARAMAIVGQGAAGVQVLGLGRKSTDWKEVAHATWPLLAEVLRRPPPTAMPDDDPQPRAAALLLALANDKPADVDADAAAAIRKSVADWAFQGLSAQTPEVDVTRVAQHRLHEGDLPRIGDLASPAVEHWIAAGVRHHEAARALVQAATPTAMQALLQGYRRLYGRGVQPDSEDLTILAAVHRPEAVLLLLDVHAVLERSDLPADVTATAATMRTIRSEFELMATKSVLQPGRSDLATLFDRFEPHLESLLTLRNADDRWWAASLLVRFRGSGGLRKVLATMSEDDHYRQPRFHVVDPKHALALFARDVVAPLGAQDVQPLVFAALAGNQLTGKVIAIKVLEALGDDASITALRTFADDADVAALLDLPGPFSLRDMAAAAVDVRRFYHEIDQAVAGGQLLAHEGVVFKDVAFEIVDLTDKRLRTEVLRIGRERLGPPPAEPAPATPEPVAAPGRPGE